MPTSFSCASQVQRRGEASARERPPRRPVRRPPLRPHTAASCCRPPSYRPPGLAFGKTKSDNGQTGITSNQKESSSQEAHGWHLQILGSPGALRQKFSV